MTITSNTCPILFKTDERDQALPRPLRSSRKWHSVSTPLCFSPKGQGASNPLPFFEGARNHQSSPILNKGAGYFSVHFVLSNFLEPARKSQNIWHRLWESALVMSVTLDCSQKFTTSTMTSNPSNPIQLFTKKQLERFNTQTIAQFNNRVRLLIQHLLIPLQSPSGVLAEHQMEF